MWCNILSIIREASNNDNKIGFIIIFMLFVILFLIMYILNKNNS